MALIITTAGLDALATAETTGVKLKATHMAVGDGGGQSVSHTSQSVVLINETWRGDLQVIKKKASGEVGFETNIPLMVGGWYIREIAIYADETLLAVGSHPELWKPEPEAPDKVEVVVSASIKFGNTDNLNLVVDPTFVNASQSHVAGKISNHNNDPNAHGGPHATKNHNHTTKEVSDLLSDPHQWAEGQCYRQTTLAINAGVVNWDMESKPHTMLILTEDVTSFVIGNFKAGGTYELTIRQDAIGNRTCSWPVFVLWPDGTVLDITADPNSEDIINFSVRDNDGSPVLRAFFGQNFKAVI